jgi:hypothetical protein
MVLYGYPLSPVSMPHLNEKFQKFEKFEKFYPFNGYQKFFVSLYTAAFFTLYFISIFILLIHALHLWL